MTDAEILAAMLARIIGSGDVSTFVWDSVSGMEDSTLTLNGSWAITPEEATAIRRLR